MSMFSHVFLNVSTTDRGIEISGIDTKAFRQFIKDKWASNKFFDKFFTISYRWSLVCDNFFVPELVYLLTTMANERPDLVNVNRIEKIISLINENTWFNTASPDISSSVDIPIIDSAFITKYKLKPYQREFVQDIYWQKKTRYRLNGYLLSLEQGLGKTYTSLALSAGLHKKSIVILGPLSSIKNTWIKEITEIYSKPQSIWTLDNRNVVNPKFFIVNYENIDKLHTVLNLIDKESNMVIVDECHNFKNIKSLRTTELLKFVNTINCTDILPMSGTPIKALGEEMVPILKLIDPFFTPEIEVRFKEIIRSSVSIANELLHHRLGMMMYRKLKTDVLSLPPKYIEQIQITIPNGDEYTLDTVKTHVLKFAESRRDYYLNNSDKYFKVYNDCINIFEQSLESTQDKKAFSNYKAQIQLIKKHGYSGDNRRIVEETNAYEKSVILPVLPSNLRKDFKAAKSVVKYVELKILGEIIGGLLNQLRIRMFSEMISYSNLIELIANAQKKVIVFSSYREVISTAEKFCKKHKYDPLVVTGDNSNDAINVLKLFSTNINKNPLIASIQTLSSSHTILAANTVVFLNTPYRSVDFDQASDRVHRIGQDVPVYIYTFILYTGEQPNLSTRMDDIIQWSKEQFSAIVNGVENDPLIASFFNDYGMSTAHTILDRIRKLIGN